MVGINANHFTLLDIDEQTKIIYHYDSMASHRLSIAKQVYPSNARHGGKVDWADYAKAALIRYSRNSSA